jgi:L-asparagine transporter-like permease
MLTIKSIDAIMRDSENQSFERTLGVWDLILIGIGGIIGTGTCGNM